MGALRILLIGELGNQLLERQGGDLTRAMPGFAHVDLGRTACRVAEDVNGAMARHPEVEVRKAGGESPHSEMSVYVGGPPSGPCGFSGQERDRAHERALQSIVKGFVVLRPARRTYWC